MFDFNGDASMKKRASMVFIAIVISLVQASTNGGGDLSPCSNKALFIDSMPENFGQYITTEIMSQKLKFTVTLDANKAACLMKGTVNVGGRFNTGSASLQIAGPTGDVIWSGTSGDKDSIKDLAHNLVKQLKHDLGKK
jgi:hypothetical protein